MIFITAGHHNKDSGAVSVFEIVAVGRAGKGYALKSIKEYFD